MDAVRFVSRPTVGDLARVTFDQAFRSLGSQAVHGFGWGVAAFGLLLKLPLDVWLPPTFMAVLFGTGLFSAAVLWWIHRRRPDRLVETVIADEDGIEIAARESHVRAAWTMYREARESALAFQLNSVRTVSQVLAKRGASEDDLDGFRELLRNAGLLRDRSPRIRGLVGFVLGAIVAMAVPFVAGIVRLG